MPYPDNFCGFPAERELTEAEILIAAHRPAIRNAVAFAFKQWPLDCHVMPRRALIDAAATTAQCAIEEHLSMSDAMKWHATEERLNYLDANRANDQAAVMQCLESMLYVYELLAEDGK